MKQFLAKILSIILIIGISYSFVDTEEYNAKLAYIERFTRFVKWPEKEGNLKDQFRIGILEKNPFSSALNKLIKTKKIKGRKITFKVIQSIQEIENIDLLFVPENHKLNINEVLEQTNSKQILTISEKKGYTSKGFMINLSLKYGELKFELNKKMIDKIGFQVHSKLYGIASKVIK